MSLNIDFMSHLYLNFLSPNDTTFLVISTSAVLTEGDIVPASVYTSNILEKFLVGKTERAESSGTGQRYCSESYNSKGSFPQQRITQPQLLIGQG